MTTNTKRLPKPRKKKTSETKQHRVYVTYFPDKRFYIGYSGKSEKLYEKYYGSSKLVTEYKGQLEKETLYTTKNKNEAKIQEFLLQWQCRHDSLCLNDMIHLRLRLKYLDAFRPIVWAPRHSSDTFVGTITGDYLHRRL
jgi:hypothetical protein